MTQEEIDKMIDPLYFASHQEQKRVIESRTYTRIDKKEKSGDGEKSE